LEKQKGFLKMQKCICPESWCETCPYKDECSKEGKQEVNQEVKECHI